MLGRHRKVVCCLRKIACRLKQETHLGGNVGNMALVEVKKGGCRLGAPGRFPRRLDRVVERAIVEEVHESVSDRDGPLRQFLFTERLNDSVYAMKCEKTLFGVGEVHAQRSRNDRA